jgi:hypothetical protein
MPNFAVIKNNIVDNIIIANSLEIAESVVGLQCVEYGTIPVNIGDQYINGEFIKPIVEE